MWYKNVDTHFFCFVTKHVLDRQTDGQKGLGTTVCCITCSCKVTKLEQLEQWHNQIVS